MTFDDSKIQLPIHYRLYRQEERAARCKGVKAMGFFNFREEPGFVLPYAKTQRIEVASHPGLQGSGEKSGFGAFHPARMLNITSKFPDSSTYDSPQFSSLRVKVWLVLLFLRCLQPDRDDCSTCSAPVPFAFLSPRDQGEFARPHSHHMLPVTREDLKD